MLFIQCLSPIEKNRCFQCWKWNTSSNESEMLSALKASIFHAFFQHWKWNAFSLIWPYFSRYFFHQQWKRYKIQETLNILNALKFKGSHLGFYEWKASFSLISPIIFSLGCCKYILQLVISVPTRGILVQGYLSVTLIDLVYSTN